MRYGCSAMRCILRGNWARRYPAPRAHKPPGISKAGVTLSGTPALMLKETYEKGAEDLLALEEAASFEQQQILMSGALSRMAAHEHGGGHPEAKWVQNLGWNLSSLAAPINYNPDDSLSGGSGASSSNWRSGSLLNW